MRDVGSGDKLARGAIKATYLVSENTLAQEKWNDMFRKEPVERAVYKFTCPVHGEFVSERKCFLSGGYPLYDETLTTRCTIDDCGEKLTVSGYVEIE